MFMYDSYTHKLPNAFKDLFKKISNRHSFKEAIKSNLLNSY